jgi:hypothetical protein
MLVYRVTEVFVCDDSSIPLKNPPIELSSLPPLVPASGDGERDIDEGFRAFWEKYPKKRSRREARHAWLRLRPDAVLLGRILAAIDAQKRTAEWQREGGRFIPRPHIWLAEERWLDVLDAPRPRPALPSYNPVRIEGPIVTRAERQRIYAETMAQIQARPGQVGPRDSR